MITKGAYKNIQHSFDNLKNGNMPTILHIETSSHLGISNKALGLGKRWMWCCVFPLSPNNLKQLLGRCPKLA